MKKLCFGALATVLVQCMAPTTTQKQLVADRNDAMADIVLQLNKKSLNGIR